MDREANLPVPPPSRAIPNQDTSSSTSSSSSPPGFIRDVQAAFKRHRSLGTVQTNGIMPRRMVVPQRTASRNVGANVDTNKSRDCVSLSHGQLVKDKIIAGESQEDASITPPSITGTITKTFDENFNPFDVDQDQPKEVVDQKENNLIPLRDVESQHVDGQRKVQLLPGHHVSSQGAHDGMATGLENLSSHMGSLALTEMEWDTVNQVEAQAVVNNESKHQHFRNTESEINLKSDGAISSLAKRTTIIQDQLHQLRNFLGQPLTQSSVVGSSCATTTSIHSSSAPMLNLTTYCSHSHSEGGSYVAKEPLGDIDVNHQLVNQVDMLQQPFPSTKEMNRMLVDQTALAAQASTSGKDAQEEVKKFDLSKKQEGGLANENELLKDPESCPQYNKSTKGQDFAGDVTNIQSQAPLSKDLTSDVKLEPSKAEKQGKVPSSKGASAPRKRNYDPDLFFKVNGKLYQRLGKIGSGGSSEVHKVISSDCTIYALKKIKLKGRDYATAYGFCQEIEYLNRLKGKNNIIQLIDYEVTDKNLLREVMNGCMSNKDGRVKDDGYLYMVLEYGEIDLAHMLSQKWKEMGSSNQTIDENWLRFYWQQILQAVNTIHEERIVHSDLKPANFLLVKGSLKLIDFGIAKAIMSDTTNIQRDSQVGTLSYMSPEAFMCNESDANGNTIKCGRPSDIWSLGCILYQMVYGRTPFAEYKSFWSKFKVITDPNHEITYGPVSNPWLLDLMKKCLAWDRNERWRIPQLLKHPFLVPPVPPEPSFSQDQSCQLLQLIEKACGSNQDALVLCSQLTQLLRDPMSQITSQSLTSQEQECRLLSQMSKLCFQLQEHLSKPG
ncbi:PREDICTED: probable serine/threonine-protein kinase mps1 isoform X1 [Theobroma cacao]|uniref:Probable serine/threonine-protein kinase mps1 isoform X1 n=1 Tax=Theobroma cacao TaxID=3641 RepID=A0AB32WTH7_THECC|nr:PREDICTED: probable serine/threonine-protein kinase mps1 isoform X1 [Theobroma cacao]